MSRLCVTCGQEVPPSLSLDEYNRRAIPRLESIDILASKIDFSSSAWKYTPEGKRYNRLMAEQGRDEYEAGL